MDDLFFEWDEEKAASNLSKHGVSFLAAAAIFDHEVLDRIDDREDYGESRHVALGRCGATILRVVYTWRSERTIRLISAQKAGRHEREIYHRTIFGARDP